MTSVIATTGTIAFSTSHAGDVLRTLEERAEETSNVIDAGCKGDGETDDTEAFKRALAKPGKVVWVPPTNAFYKVDVDQLMVGRAKIILGIPPGVMEPGYPGSRIATLATSGKIFTVIDHGARLEGLGIEGLAPVNSGLWGVYAARLANTDDLDFTQVNCHGRNLNTFNESIGRGLTARHNTFAGGTGAETMFVRNWPTSGIGPGQWQDLPYGFGRKDFIEFNHGHGISNFTVVQGAARSFYTGILRGNKLDIGGRLYQGGGDITLDGNEVKHSPTTIIYLDAPTPSLRLTGGKLQGTPGDLQNSPAHCLWSIAGAPIGSFIISGVQMGDCDSAAMCFDDDISHGTINGNVIQNYGQDQTGIDPGILFDRLALGKRAKNVAIVANAFIDGPGSDMPLWTGPGAKLQGVKALGNTWNPASGAFAQGSFIDEGGNALAG